MKVSQSVTALFLIVSICSCFAEFQSDEEPVYYAIEDSDDFEDSWIPFKRAGFWSPHPSDYNPMRRPGPYPRTSLPNPKRSDGGARVPYHPHARIITIKQDQRRSMGYDNEDNEAIGSRSKKQTRAATLIHRLRSGGNNGGNSINVRRNGNRRNSGQQE